MQAKWNGKIIAESNDTTVVDGNHYFPADSINKECFRPSETTTICGWKGTANYYDVVVDDDENRQAAWYYADPKPEAAHIKSRVAFWKGIEISE